MLVPPEISAVVYLLDTSRVVHLAKSNLAQSWMLLDQYFTAFCYPSPSFYDLRNVTGSYSCDRCCKIGYQKILRRGSDMEVTTDACLLGNKQIQDQVSLTPVFR